VDREDPSLAATDVAVVVSTSDDRPIVVERAMYLSREGEMFTAGHASSGAVRTATRWWFAEGATGTFFDTFLLAGNPEHDAAELEVTYLLPDGGRIVRQHRVAAESRLTIWVDAEEVRVAASALAIEIRSINGVPVVVERAMWWPGPTASTWYEAHVNAGLPTTAARWGSADVEVGSSLDGMSTFLLVANTSAVAGDVAVTLAFEGAPMAAETRVFHIEATSRLDVDIGAAFPEARGRRASALIESRGASPLALVVERATYWSVGARFWSAGATAPAVPLPQ
jgi:hypothetical protein